MLGSLFSELCAYDVPVSEDCWEISRLVTCPPPVAGTSIVKLHRLLALALTEFALLNGIKRYTLVTGASPSASVTVDRLAGGSTGLACSVHGPNAASAPNYSRRPSIGPSSAEDTRLGLGAAIHARREESRMTAPDRRTSLSSDAEP